MSVSLHQSGTGRSLHIQFRRRLDQPLVIGTLWGSADLQQWQRLDAANPNYEETIQVGENPLFEEVSATLSLPPGDAPYFLRFQATADL